MQSDASSSLRMEGESRPQAGVASPGDGNLPFLPVMVRRGESGRLRLIRTSPLWPTQRGGVEHNRSDDHADCSRVVWQPNPIRRQAGLLLLGAGPARATF